MQVETCHYRLSLRGKPVGTHTLSTSFRGRTAILDAKMMLQAQGALRNTTIAQQSKAHRQQFFSFSFQETISVPESRTFKVHFDIEEGLVKAERGGNDKAFIPYIESYEDPLSLLYHLRHLNSEDYLRVPMLGKEVVVERLGEKVLETALGEHAAHVYRLRPGGSYVYVSVDAPHPILMMTQRFDNQLLDAHIVRIDENARAPQEPNRRRKRRRKRRRN